MQRTTRSKSKASTLAPEPKIPRGRPRKHPDADVEAEQPQGETASRSSQTASKRTETSTSVSRRQTRSQRALLGNEEVQALTRSRRNRSDIEEIEDKPPKRQRFSSRHEGNESQEEDDRDSGQESAPNKPFFDKINKIILPASVPEGSLPRTTNQDRKEGNIQNQVQEEESHAARQAIVSGVDNTEEPEPKVVITQLGPTRRGRPRKKKQQKKVTYGEVTVQRAREASVELGSDRPSPRRSQPNRMEPAITERTEQPEMDVYDPDNIVDDNIVHDNSREKGKGLAHDSASSLTDQEDENAEVEESTMMIVEDSIFIHPHSDNENEHAPVVAELNSIWLHDMTSLMAGKGWTNDAKWEAKFVVEEEGEKPSWLKSHEGSLQRKRCRNLFLILHRLWWFCHGMPRAPRWEEQATYLRENKTLQKSIQSINSLVNHIYKNFQPWAMRDSTQRDLTDNWGQPAKESLLEKLIPMFVLVLKESFKAGGVVTTNNGKEISMLDEGRFTSLTLDLPLRIVGWLKRLHGLLDTEIMMRYPKLSSDEKPVLKGLKKPDVQRRKLERYIDKAQHSIQQALDRLEYLSTAPQREMEAKERDEAIRRARKEKQQEMHDAQERQMQLFVESLHRMNEPKRGEPQRGPSDLYFIKNGGWYKHEDLRLLDMIRKMPKHKVEALAPLVPGRSVEEVAERVKNLRERMWNRYENAELTPPVWCFEQK